MPSVQFHMSNLPSYNPLKEDMMDGPPSAPPAYDAPPYAAVAKEMNSMDPMKQMHTVINVTTSQPAPAQQILVVGAGGGCPSCRVSGSLIFMIIFLVPFKYQFLFLLNPGWCIEEEPLHLLWGFLVHRFISDWTPVPLLLHKISLHQLLLFTVEKKFP